ncbi:D-tyrosyl-tRNA(Tyr) deacylase [Psychroflexus sp. CAK57W]|uniref:D-aminoacyl-tRNA deacylase n=1 Tax=Psychroflexus curvus TaxID=2873595 RepID=UPI001CCB9901|nr:D-aminoacyl-tRNA deacylase [Psychroflexus curvus]MBZ9627644.1 D-tyrosyl-tRNA(Tyr) deacylase [Psychroflexus curvus]MBZ9786131.1 D-tyrosyl-tRNA(Tyr) deacylase [Psychroflexus curvus]
MRIILQRVKKASVEIDTQIAGSIHQGLLIYLGVEDEDKQEDIDWLVKKVTHLRIFSDEEGKMNLNIRDIEGEFLIVSQFTLYASTKKGNRPSFTNAAKPELAKKLYQDFIETLKSTLVANIQTGRFGANMQVASVNDGPLTFILDSKQKV